MIVFVFAGAMLLVQETPPPTCSLHPVREQWEGSCGVIDEGRSATLSIAPAREIKTGAWRRDKAPSSMWSGTIVLGEYPATPVEIEVYDDGRGVMRTLFGWFAVARFALTPEAMYISADFSQEVAPCTVDREIVKRAAQILSSEAVWNRADDRKCPADATSWSIYCAMEWATAQVAGAFHHRRPALQVVRRIVDERTAGRAYEHRLMDYNNDPTTRFEDVSTLFGEALKRIDEALER